MVDLPMMRERSLVQVVAGLVGAVFLIVGIAGFIPGITTHLYEGLDFAGHDGNAQLIGLFQVSVLHNLVHIALGIVGLALARTSSGARTFLIGGGIVYLALWLYGLIIDKDSSANFVPLDRADDWLHFLLGLGMIVAGVLTTRERAVVERPATP
jgi:Domain of unknown function (DUF4383)